MTYQEFLLQIKEQILKHIEEPESYDVTIRKVRKNNGVVLDGLSIIGRNQNVSPTIYLNSYFEQYQEGRDFESIIREIYFIYVNHPPENFEVEPEDFNSYEFVKGSVFFRIVNYETNQILLEDCPFYRIQDLAVTFRVLAQKDDKGIATVMVTNAMMKLWKLTMEELKALAVVNTPILFPMKVEPLTKVLEDYIHLDYPESVPLFVLTNSIGINGASCILYEDALKNLSQEWDSDIYILPSSVHEVLLLPVQKEFDKDYLETIVQESNKTVVSKEEFLSDHVYYYLRKTNEIIII
ncbi:MAG: hypothetical protein IJA10_03660 [Lachnospiraceae bacterium]|nr:hypothetical protein [Lachnospiraceae bacterium]